MEYIDLLQVADVSKIHLWDTSSVRAANRSSKIYISKLSTSRGKIVLVLFSINSS